MTDEDVIQRTIRRLLGTVCENCFCYVRSELTDATIHNYCSNTNQPRLNVEPSDTCTMWRPE